MKSIAMIKTKKTFFSFSILIFISLISAYGEVVLNTIYALVATKNDFNFLSRFGVNVVQLLASAGIIFYLINTVFSKVQFFEIREKVNFSKILETRWASLFLIIPIIVNNHFMLIEKSLVYVLLFAFFIILYLFFQSKNYLSLINIKGESFFSKKNLLYLASLILSDLVLIELIQFARKPLGF